MFKRIFIYGILHRVISTNTFSRWVGRWANKKFNKSFLLFVIKRYISYFKIDMNQYDLDLSDIKTFNEFFTRRLKDGSRIWEEGIASPVDGRVLSFGKVENGMLFQVKGKYYSETELTFESSERERSFINLYLSPADYHRVHAPFDMQISKVRHIPGKLLSVSKKNAQTVDNLYVKNERVILSGRSEYGNFHFVFVGATNVGSIKLSFFPELSTNQGKAQIQEWHYNKEIKKGEEVGLFEMGSTIVMILASSILQNCKPILLDNPVKLGQSLISFDI